MAALGLIVLVSCMVADHAQNSTYRQESYNPSPLGAAYALVQGAIPSPIPGGIVPSTGPSLPTPPTPSTQTVQIPSSTNYTISRTASGLLLSDSFTNETRTQQQLQASHSYWTYDGDAPGEKAPYTVWRDLQGLHIGVQAPSNGTFAGYYAQTQQSKAVLYHVQVTTPVSTIPVTGEVFENGMYVQNGTMDVNYITCTSMTSGSGTQWALVAANGNIYGANTFTPLWWTAKSPSQPLTADCTIITNGTNYLKAYINGVNVYESRNLDLNMSNDFITFMEPQTTYAGQMLNGTFKDFYATSGGNITVTNIPAYGNTVKIVQPTNPGNGVVLASSQVDGTGSATLYVEGLAMPIHAYVIVYDSKGNPVASTSGAVDIYGGDSYSVSGSALSYTVSSTNPLPAPTGLSASTVSMHQINLKWSAPSTLLPLTGYKIERLTGNDPSWLTLVPDTGSQATTYSDTLLAPNTEYTYRVSAVYAAVTSSPTKTASATTLATTYPLEVLSVLRTGGTLDGMFTVLANSTGKTVATGWTPVTFALNTGMQYTVTVGNYATNIFDHWQDTGSTSNSRSISISSNTQITAVYRDTALSVSPSSGTGGSSVTATGTTFLPSHVVTLSLDGTNLATNPASVVTNSTGGFIATFMIPAGISTGLHTVSATDGTNSHSTTLSVN